MFHVSEAGQWVAGGINEAKKKRRNQLEMLLLESTIESLIIRKCKAMKKDPIYFFQIKTVSYKIRIIKKKLSTVSKSIMEHKYINHHTGSRKKDDNNETSMSKRKMYLEMEKACVILLMHTIGQTETFCCGFETHLGFIRILQDLDTHISQGGSVGTELIFIVDNRQKEIFIVVSFLRFARPEWVTGVFGLTI